MKKVLSVIMVMAMLLISAVSVFASVETRFIEQATGGEFSDEYILFLSENGCLYKAYTRKDEFRLDYITNGVKDLYRVNLMENHNIYHSAVNYLYLNNDGVLYDPNLDEIINTDILDTNGENLYRKSDNSLYVYVVKSDKKLDNCSNVYGFVCKGSERFYYAKTNDEVTR